MNVHKNLWCQYSKSIMKYGTTMIQVILEVLQVISGIGQVLRDFYIFDIFYCSCQLHVALFRNLFIEVNNELFLPKWRKCLFSDVAKVGY